MDNLHETQFFDSVDKEVQNEAKNILLNVSEALKEKGYNVIIPDFPTKADITLDGYLTVFAKYKNLQYNTPL